MNLSILYRGYLSSCNYACEYCPFAKKKESREELQRDRQALERYVHWCAERQRDNLAILFTPWGEALIRPWYQQALVDLTGFANVSKAAIQTNLSCKLDWIEHCDQRKLALWCTFHPGEVTHARFLDQCRRLHVAGVRFSVGVVGLKEYREAIVRLREELPKDVYLWINAYKRMPNYYDPELLELFSMIDPLFPVNNQYHPSLGEECRTGHRVISVDGDGNVRRCHFIAEKIGNIYEHEFDQCLRKRPCTNQSCGCHIGYVHLERLGLERVFREGVLERIPASHELIPLE